jgi:D-glycero-D-manno-heptose 1,7-bisphosphate phosphatase
MAELFLIDGVGLWAQQRTGADFKNRPAVFLDGDGVIAEEVHFLNRPQDVRLTFGIGEAIAALNRLAIAVVVITNQSGIARGRFGWTAFAAVQEEIADQLARAGGGIDATFACAYHRDGTGALAVADHPWRKPKPGMLWEAKRLLGLDPRKSLVVGDRMSDLEAGCAAGLANGAIVRTGYGEREGERLAEADERWRARGFSAGVADHAAQAIWRWAAAQGERGASSQD